jgi:3D (Asp-Asp-Asp) domain-containing protein
MTINELHGQIDNFDNVIAEKDAENERLQLEIGQLKDSKYEFKYLGTYKITYYCDERYTDHICGGSGVTASGIPTEVGTTIAVDPSVIPYGTEVYIEGIGYRTAQDRGGAVNGNHIDVLVKTHNEAMSLGTTYRDVWIIVQN